LLDNAEGEVDDVLTPVLLVCRQPISKAVVVNAKAEEKMFRVAKLGLGAVEFAAAISEVDGVENVTAVIALVAAGVGIAADGAGAST